jgi:hypothetical protein
MPEDKVMYVETPKLRFVLREEKRILQQWFAPDLPKYMVDPRIGEWRDIPMVEVE